MIKLTNRYNLIILACILVAVITHLWYISIPSLNLEWVFTGAAQAMLHPEGKHWGMKAYWEYEANPLGYSLVVAFFAKLWHQPVSIAVARVPSLWGYFMLIIAGFIACCDTELLDRKQLCWWVALITFSPLIWLFTGHATAEILPLGLLMLCLALSYHANNRTLPLLLIGCVYGFAMIVKFHCALFGLAFLYIFYMQAGYKWSANFIKATVAFFLPAIVFVGLYFALVYEYSGVWLIAPQFKGMYTPTFENFVVNLFNYAAFLPLTLGPIALLPLIDLFHYQSWRRRIVFLVVMTLFAALNFWLFHHRNGEMNYGSFDYIFNLHFFVWLSAFGAVLFVGFILHALFERKRFRQMAHMVLVTVLPYLVVCALVRPAQRYLIFLQPILFLYIVICASSYRRISHWLMALTIIPFMLCLIPAVSYQLSEAHAADDVAQWLQKHRHLSDTAPGAIDSHAGNYFFPYRQLGKAPLWQVNSGKVLPPGVYYHRRINILGHPVKSYYVVKNTHAQE